MGGVDAFRYRMGFTPVSMEAYEAPLPYIPWCHRSSHVEHSALLTPRPTVTPNAARSTPPLDTLPHTPNPGLLSTRTPYSRYVNNSTTQMP